MTTHSLEQAIERYEHTIATLEADREQLSAEQILDVLLARSRVQMALTTTSKSGFHDWIRQLIHRKPRSGRRRAIRWIKQLDTRLGRQAAYIQQAIQLDDWQLLLQAPERDWLGLLDPPRPIPWRDRYDWLWQGMALAFLTMSFSLLADLATRFFEGGPDAIGAFAIIVPSVLGLLSGGGALTKTGQQAIEHILSSLKIAQHWWDELNCLFSAGLLLSLTLFWLSLPQVSLWYESNADAAYRQGQLATAEADYNRALKISPQHLDVHYKLGRLYEDVRDVDRAMAEYQIAVKGRNEGESYKAFDRLARLYILEDSAENDSKAVSLLREGLSLAEVRQDQEVLYATRKNLGWARVQQERYAEAIASLNTAITLYRDRAAAYCLKAQALEGLKETAEATDAWEQCLRYANQTDPDEDIWIGLALKRLKAAGDKS